MTNLKTDMIEIDGILYDNENKPYIYKDYKNCESLLEDDASNHINLIFPKDIILIKKTKMETEWGKKTISDGFYILINKEIKDSILGIIEYELEEHGYEHVFLQVERFEDALKTPKTRQILTKHFYNEINSNLAYKSLLNSFGITEIYKYINDIIEYSYKNNKYKITIIYDKYPQQWIIDKIKNKFGENSEIKEFKTRILLEKEQPDVCDYPSERKKEEINGVNKSHKDLKIREEFINFLGFGNKTVSKKRYVLINDYPNGTFMNIRVGNTSIKMSYTIPIKKGEKFFQKTIELLEKELGKKLEISKTPSNENQIILWQIENISLEEYKFEEYRKIYTIEHEKINEIVKKLGLDKV